MKIGVIGSREWVDRARLYAYLAELVNPETDIIVSGGQPKGADGMAKDWALENGMANHYREHAPAHFRWNRYCVKGPEHYQKPYRVSHYNERNRDIAEDSDVILAFIPAQKGYNSRGTMNTCGHMKQFGKTVVIVSETTEEIWFEGDTGRT